MSGIIIL